ncbi:hypothetical protein [Lonepinella sp. MS14436]|uniref:hypothetical protein n=1 Tax=Lonepinella sp. MS14436 TaxID=3003619 RepID=UPI0036DDF055
MAAGEFSRYMQWEEGSWQKVALHAALGATSAEAGGGNVVAGAVAGGTGEILNTKVADYLATQTALSPQARKTLQQLSAAGIGAAAGNLAGGNADNTYQGMNIAHNAEVYNRQLHPTEIQLIRDHAKDFAKRQGISEEEAQKQLTAESLRGVSDDFAYVEENQTARAYLNQLQAEVDNQKLFAVLDRKSAEYKNSLINSDYVYKNQDLYNKVHLGNTSLSTSDLLLSKALKESQSYHSQAGKQTVEHVYGDITNQIADYKQLSNQHSLADDEASQNIAILADKNAHNLKDTVLSSYPNARGLYSLSELYANDSAYSKAFAESVSESYAGVSVAGQSKTLVKVPDEVSSNGLFLMKERDLSYDNQNLGKNNSTFNNALNERITNSDKTPRSIVNKNGFYYGYGMKISESYYNKLWSVGRPAPFIQAREIINNNPQIMLDPRGREGFYQYKANGLEMIYNPRIKEIWHIQPEK